MDVVAGRGQGEVVRSHSGLDKPRQMLPQRSGIGSGSPCSQYLAWPGS